MIADWRIYYAEKENEGIHKATVDSLRPKMNNIARRMPATVQRVNLDLFRGVEAASFEPRLEKLAKSTIENPPVYSKFEQEALMMELQSLVGWTASHE